MNLAQGNAMHAIESPPGQNKGSKNMEKNLPDPAVDPAVTPRAATAGGGGTL